MSQSRRTFLSTAAATAVLATMPLTAHAEPLAWNGLPQPVIDEFSRLQIIDEFNRLPGRKALKIWAPGGDDDREFLVTINPDTALFCASSFKVFVLAEFLRQMEAGQTSLTELLPVDDSVWSLSAPVLTPLPGSVTGQIQARTALEAMIARSDNTGTDIALKRVGVDRVRQFIDAIGLTNTRIPNSTRQFFGYIGGAPNWSTITWPEVLALFQSEQPAADHIINHVQTMAASPHDFVSFYSRALQGGFFQHPETLMTFRSVLALADAIPLAMPLGVNAFLKGGSIDFGGEHAFSVAGGMFIPPRRWVYYSLMTNWLDAEGGDTAEVQGSFANACKQIFTLLRDQL
ncbi:MAG: class A beta-lactamase-related serine hydrolase [Candidatus Contendobacter sp.]|nr:class A beta-lactamase-related serine hydrolase [Candidatus Contendobacter sp.]